MHRHFWGNDRSRFARIGLIEGDARLEVSKTVEAEQQNAARRLHLAPLVSGHQMEGVHIFHAQPPDRCEGLGSGSEVDCFRVEAGYRPFVECLAAREALHLGDERFIGPQGAEAQRRFPRACSTAGRWRECVFSKSTPDSRFPSTSSEGSYLGVTEIPKKKRG